MTPCFWGKIHAKNFLLFCKVSVFLIAFWTSGELETFNKIVAYEVQDYRDDAENGEDDHISIGFQHENNVQLVDHLQYPSSHNHGSEKCAPQ